MGKTGSGKFVWVTGGRNSGISVRKNAGIPPLRYAGFNVSEARDAGLADLRAIGFSVADALAGNVTDLRAAGCIGL